jgi:hypothetical protein
MPATQCPVLNKPRTYVPCGVAERREDKQEQLTLKREITKWKHAKSMRRQLKCTGFVCTAMAVAETVSGKNFVDFMAARESNPKTKEEKELLKALDKYVTVKVESKFGVGCLVNPEKRLPENSEGSECMDEEE